MSIDRSVLERLAGRHGVLMSYHDIWGHRHEAADATLIALLAELGVDASSAESAAASEAHEGERDGVHGLPPVIAVAADDDTGSIAGPAAGWTLRLEDGTEKHGRGPITGRLPVGYHRLHASDQPHAETFVIAAPATCFEPAAFADTARVWGPAIQLYALRSQRNWGIGDFTDLLTVIDQWAARGASLVGLNPLHALFAHNPLHISPYSPSSRLRLNTLYIDVDGVPELAACDAAQALIASPEFQAELAVLRASDTVRYADVARLKTRALRLLHLHFVATHRDSPGSAAGAAYRTFQVDNGDALINHGRFEALQAFFFAADETVWGWPVWPDAYRSPAAPAVEAFAVEHADDVDFHAYLQWLAERQLALAKARCLERGMPIGLYLDLAVSVDRAGSDAWSHAALYAPRVSIGAPPDEVNTQGQGWGLPPVQPNRSRASGHRVFIETLRSVMRHAGALRIDHVMGLMRLYWIPPDQTPVDGAYVRYPLDELIAVVAIESQRQRCLVIGEDLGTVDDEIRTAMQRFQLLSYRLLYFERRHDGAFKGGDDYPRRALVAVSTHDLPTLAGWWTAHDIAVRQRLGLYPSAPVHEKQLAARAQDRVRLLLALERSGLLPAGTLPTLDAAPHLTAELAEAVHAYVANTAAEVMLVQLEDVLGVEDQANLPGTVDEHPNWRQRLPLGLEAQATDQRFESLAQRLSSIRPRPRAAHEALRGAEAVVPRATYRLQFHQGFTFDDGVAVLPYLQRLGVSHVYCSPILRARAGSTHGYDVVAHDQINPELGGAAGFERFAAALHAHGMGQLIDMVPNHMGVGADNAWWMDVLENGMSSPQADTFDIDWHPVNAELDGKVLLPVLGQQYGEVLSAGELQLAFDASAGSFAFGYHAHRFPIDPTSYAELLHRASERVSDANAAAQLQSLATAFSHLPSNRVRSDSAEALERQRDQGLLKQRLAALCSPPLAPGDGWGEGPRSTAMPNVPPHPNPSPQRGEGLLISPVSAAIAAELAVANSAADKEALHALHERQAYRLAFWRVAADEINYRRFFDINELAGLRIEEPPVFEATQGLALDLAAAGLVDGLRIDHPDGLQNPAEYFARLQDGFAKRAGIAMPTSAANEARTASASAALASADDLAGFRPLYVVAEKIAASHETVPAEWRIHGTTGYRFAMVVNGVLVDAESEAAFDAIWARHAGVDLSFAELAYQGKRAVAASALASELTVLATVLLRIAKGRRESRDYTFNSLRSTLAEIAACLPVYRTYVVEQPSAQDERYIDWAVTHACRRSRLADLSIFDFARRCMKNDAGDGANALQADAVRRFAWRFQQFSSPIAAKGVEDTAFYRYHRLVSLNEVGGDPATFGMSVRAFHGANADRLARWPDTIIATSTHDNKRSEDVRCRIDVLSEMPEAWSAALARWQTLSSVGRSELATLQSQAPSAKSAKSDDSALSTSPIANRPAPADEYLLYQTLLGTLPAEGLDDAGLPAYRERIAAYWVKAVREGKERSSWTQPDEAYEAVLDAFLQSLLGRVKPNPLLSDVQALATELAPFGALNSLSMTLLKYSVPGVPDLYQGNEFIDLSLVDPDNRRPVDYRARDHALREMNAWSADGELATHLAELARSPTDGRLKLWVTHRLLAMRSQLPALFARGDYVAVAAKGDLADHVIAFSRQLGKHTLVIAAGRLFARFAARQNTTLPLGRAWGDTALDLATLNGLTATNVLTGEQHTIDAGSLPMADAFAGLPAAALLLHR